MYFWNSLAVILSITALFGYINERFLHLPASIGIMLLALLSTLVLVVLQHVGIDLTAMARRLLLRVDFDETVLHGLVGFLLFSGALSLNVSKLRSNAYIVAVLALVGTLLSTVIVGVSTYYLLILLGQPIPLVYALIFGALISPTDPIAVLAILRKANAPENLELQIAGESLFNDGVGLTLFLFFSHLSIYSDGLKEASLTATLELFAQQALGGLLFGAVLGGVAYYLMSGIKNYNVVILLFLAIASGGYAFAQVLDVSGALAMVVAGLILGHDGRHYKVMTNEAHSRVKLFWEIMDELLNALLFMLLGLEFLLLFKGGDLSPVILMVPLVVFARFISVSLPWLILKRYYYFDKGALAIMTWGGLRGGLAVALALSLPNGSEREIIVAMTYGVVIFSVLVQGTSIGALVKHYTKTT